MEWLDIIFCPSLSVLDPLKKKVCSGCQHWGELFILLP